MQIILDQEKLGGCEYGKEKKYFHPEIPKGVNKMRQSQR